MSALSLDAALAALGDLLRAADLERPYHGMPADTGDVADLAHRGRIDLAYRLGAAEGCALAALAALGAPRCPDCGRYALPRRTSRGLEWEHGCPTARAEVSP
jgi:hypothetical protein